jgi:hypothetical protein
MSLFNKQKGTGWEAWHNNGVDRGGHLVKIKLSQEMASTLATALSNHGKLDELRRGIQEVVKDYKNVRGWE